MDDEFRHSKHPLPENIKNSRNLAIILSVIELVCAIVAIGLYAMRRSKIVLVIVAIAILACGLGLYAKITLSYWGLFAHAAITISVMGGFLIYLIIEASVGSEHQQ